MRISDWSSDVCSSDLMAQYSERLRDPKWRASPVGRRLGHHEVQYAVSQIGGSGDTACAQGTREFPPADALDQCRQDDGDCAQKTGVVSDDAEKQGSREQARSEEHTSELQSLMRISYAGFCLKQKKKHQRITCQSHHKNNKKQTTITINKH